MNPASWQRLSPRHRSGALGRTWRNRSCWLLLRRFEPKRYGSCDGISAASLACCVSFPAALNDQIRIHHFAVPSMTQTSFEKRKLWASQRCPKGRKSLLSSLSPAGVTTKQHLESLRTCPTPEGAGNEATASSVRKASLQNMGLKSFHKKLGRIILVRNQQYRGMKQGISTSNEGRTARNSSLHIFPGSQHVLHIMSYWKTNYHVF